MAGSSYFEFLTGAQDLVDALPKAMLADPTTRKIIDDVSGLLGSRDHDLEDFLDGTWVASGGASDLAVGTASASLVGFSVQGGSTVITAISGGADVTFPGPFSQGVVCVVAGMGDSTPGGETVQVPQSSKSLSGFKAQIMDNGSEIVASTWRVDWLAFGF